MAIKVSKLSNPAKLRAALYGLTSAVLGVLVLKKLITEGEFVAYMAVASALLGVAFYNVADPAPDTDSTEPLRESHGERDYEGAPLHDDELGR